MESSITSSPYGAVPIPQESSPHKDTETNGYMRRSVNILCGSGFITRICQYGNFGGSVARAVGPAFDVSFVLLYHHNATINFKFITAELLSNCFSIILWCSI